MLTGFGVVQRRRPSADAPDDINWVGPHWDAGRVRSRTRGATRQPASRATPSCSEAIPGAKLLARGPVW